MICKCGKAGYRPSPNRLPNAVLARHGATGFYRLPRGQRLEIVPALPGRPEMIILELRTIFKQHSLFPPPGGPLWNSSIRAGSWAGKRLPFPCPCKGYRIIEPSSAAKPCSFPVSGQFFPGAASSATCFPAPSAGATTRLRPAGPASPCSPRPPRGRNPSAKRRKRWASYSRKR